MKFENKLLLLAVVPIAFALIPATALLLRSQATVNEMDQLDSLAQLVWKMAEGEQGLELEQDNRRRFTPDRANDPEENRRQFRYRFR